MSPEPNVAASGYRASAVPMLWNEFPCLDFVDSEFLDHAGSGRRFDRLPLPAWQQAFLEHWGWAAPLPMPRAALPRLRDLRARLRNLLEADAGGREPELHDLDHLNAILTAVPLTYVIEAGPVVALKPRRADWDWVAAEVVRSAVEVLGRHDAGRIKLCANPDCTWLFYDTSRNRGRRWCQATVCGNLVKVRAFRARERLAGRANRTLPAPPPAG